MKKTVLVFGTFDLLHAGHKYFFRVAKQYGDRLVVVVARDENVEHIKGQPPHDSEEQRLAQVQAVDEVDEARLGYKEWGEHLRVLEDIRPDVICLGYDQKAQLPEGSWEVIRLDSHYPEKYKSSLIRMSKTKKDS